MIDTTHRSSALEEMDDFEITGEILTKTLNQIATINKVLGGNSVTINGLKKLLKHQLKETPLTIVDLGCGNGDMLRIVSDYGKKRGYTFKLIGIDANLSTVKYAEELSVKYPAISYVQQDVLANDFKGVDCDIVLSTLFLHHFTDEDSINLLRTMLHKVRIGILVNDLHRSKLAYFLYKIVTLPVKNEMVKKDGLISILRGFKRADFQHMSMALKADTSIIWKWAFRYQWIIKK